MLVFTMILFYILIVLITIVYVVYNKSTVQYFGHKKVVIETAAFIMSSLTLFFISFPSLYLLYKRGSLIQPHLTVKIVGRQWYWNFEVANLIEEPVLIYMSPIDELRVGSWRFLEVDNRLVLPTQTIIQFNVTSRDVIHRFAIPTLGIKVDATPGLLTVVHAHLTKVGTHYGQCREICGINHRFMPFCIEVVTFQSFLYWALIVNFR